MTHYNLFGTINTIFIFISLLGIYSQLKTVWHRKQVGSDESTHLLSLNQFLVSFFAYYAFFIYGYSISPFNHYIVWPRLIATVLVGLILYEIWRDRQTRAAKISFASASVVFIVGIIGFFLGPNISTHSQIVSTVLIVVVTAFIAQGYYHQIRLIIKNRDTGAVDIRMSQFILMMDFSTIAFALSMGIKNGWPLLLLAVVSGTTKIIIMYLFRWVKVAVH